MEKVAMSYISWELIPFPFITVILPLVHSPDQTTSCHILGL